MNESPNDDLTAANYDRLVLDAALQLLGERESQKPLKKQQMCALVDPNLQPKLQRAEETRQVWHQQIDGLYAELWRYMPTPEAQRLLQVLRQAGRSEWGKAVAVATAATATTATANSSRRCCLTDTPSPARLTLFGQRLIPQSFHVSDTARTFVDACMVTLNAQHWLREQASDWLAASPINAGQSSAAGSSCLSLACCASLHAYTLERPYWVSWNHARRWLLVYVKGPDDVASA